MNLLNDGNGSFRGKFVKFARNSTIYSETSRLKNPRWNRFDRNFFFFLIEMMAHSVKACRTIRDRLRDPEE